MTTSSSERDREHYRSDDPVLVTTRDIYQLASSTAGKVDSLIAMQSNQDAGFKDHELRLRRLEARFFGIVGTIALGVVGLAYFVIERLPQ